MTAEQLYAAQLARYLTAARVVADAKATLHDEYLKLKAAGHQVTSTHEQALHATPTCHAVLV